MFDWILRRLESLYLWAHRRTYRRRLARQTVFESLYVVSVGNLSAGGTGKTPVALALAKRLRAGGVRTLAVLRGYGGSVSKKSGVGPAAGEISGLLVSDGERLLADVAVAGDEALLFARAPGLRVAVGPDRAAAILQFAGDAQAVLLDDAFQNPLVGRDHELVLLDALVPLERMRVFPGGRFRDPPEALARADTILLTRVDLASPADLAALEGLIQQVAPDTPVFRGRHAPAPVVFESADARQKTQGDRNSTGNSRSVDRPRRLIGAFCGLGNPKGFFQSLASPPNEFEAVFTRAFPDHHPYSSAEIRTLFRDAERAGYPDLPFVTSAKDHVRLAALTDLEAELLERIHVLEIEFEILEERGEEFFERVLGPALLVE